MRVASVAFHTETSVSPEGDHFLHTTDVFDRKNIINTYNNSAVSRDYRKLMSTILFLTLTWLYIEDFTPQRRIIFISDGSRVILVFKNCTKVQQTSNKDIGRGTGCSLIGFW